MCAAHRVDTFNDDQSDTQAENLDRIVAYHNSRERDLDVSVHFNAAEPTDGARGCEVLFVTQDELAARVSAAISAAGQLIDRGAKYRGDLAFLNGCEMPAVLIETAFVDAGVDVTNYEANFDSITRAIAGALVD